MLVAQKHAFNDRSRNKVELICTFFSPLIYLHLVYLHPDLQKIVELLFEPKGLQLKNPYAEPEGKDYLAYRFHVNDKKVLFRMSKITPTKSGQFVTLWKRNELGITAPFDANDPFDLIIIACKSDPNLGVFIFSKFALLQHQIISVHGKGGKRGMRVYPPWDTAESKQAKKTQTWQTDYFFSLAPSGQPNQALIQKLIHV